MLAQTRKAIGGSAPPDKPAATGNSPQSGKKSAPATILVVDDEPLIRWAVRETLTDRGYEVIEAGDAASAIGAISPSGDAVDVVLLDVRLPDSADLHLLSAMCRLSSRASVILMTAHSSPELFVEAHRLGAFAVVDKPFEMDALPPLIEHALAARPH